MVEISNDNEFKEWLKGQKQPVHTAIATRVALRTFPFAAASIADKEDTFDTKALALSTARAILTSAVKCNAPTADLKAVLNSTRPTVSDTTSSTYSAAYSSFLSAGFAISSAFLNDSADSAQMAISSATLSILSTDSRHSVHRTASYSDANIIDPNIRAIA